LAHPFSAAIVAIAFMDHMYKLHGLLKKSSQIMTKYSIVSSGSNCSLSLVPLWAWVRPTILKLTDRRNVLTSALKDICDVLLTHALRSGFSG
jgi:hypothetical protein